MSAPTGRFFSLLLTSALTSLLGLTVLAGGCKKPRTTEEPGAPPAGPASTGPAVQPPGSGATPGTEPSTEPSEPTEAGPGTDGPVYLRVMAAPVLAPTVAALAKAYAAGRAGRVEVDVVSAPTKDLLGLMADGDGADVLITEGYGPLEALRAAGLVAAGTTRRVCWLPLTVSVATGPTNKTRAVSDLVAGSTVGVPDPHRRPGRLAARGLLRRLGILAKVRELIIPGEPNALLRDGVIAAYIGWGRPPEVDSLPLTRPLRPWLPIPAAATAVSDDPQAALAFVRWLGSAEAESGWTAGGASFRLDERSPVMPTVLPRPLPTPRRGAGAARVGARALLIAGEAGGELLDSLTFFDAERVVATKAKASLPSGRHGVSAGFFPKRRQVLIAGGITASGPTMEVFRYDPDGDTLKPASVRLPLPMAYSASVVVGSAMYMLGGEGTAGAKLDAIVRIDLDAGEALRLKAPLPTPRSRAAAVMAGSEVWILGGVSITGPAREILAFEPATRASRYTRHALPEGAMGAAVAPWHDGWLVAGGHRGTGLRAEIDTVAPGGRIARLPHMLPYPVRDAAAVTLPSGLYLFGGLSPTRVEARILRFPY